jgi:hypothetical protein
MKNIFFVFLIANGISIHCIDIEGPFSIMGLGWDPFYTIAGSLREKLIFGRTIDNKEYYEEKNITDLYLNKDGFYTIPIFGDDCVVLAGGNYFFIHDIKDPGYSMFRPDKDFKAFQKEHSWYSEEEYSMPGERRKTIERIIVPDILVENTPKGQVYYSVEDMLGYYARMLDWHVVCNPEAKPWATSMDPNGLAIEVEFDNPQLKYIGKNGSNHIVIMNGYVNPLKRNLYKENRRIKTLQIDSLDENKKFSMVIHFEDEAAFKRIPFPEWVRKVKLVILDYYEGAKYKDLCVQFIGTDFDMDTGYGFLYEYMRGAKKFDYFTTNRGKSNALFIPLERDGVFIDARKK